MLTDFWGQNTSSLIPFFSLPLPFICDDFKNSEPALTSIQVQFWCTWDLLQKSLMYFFSSLQLV